MMGPRELLIIFVVMILTFRIVGSAISESVITAIMVMIIGVGIRAMISSFRG